MATTSDIEKIVEEEVKTEEKHMEKHEFLALLLIIGLLVVAYSIETGSATPQVHFLNGSYANLSMEGMPLYPGSGSYSAEAWMKSSDRGDGVMASTGECCGAESYWSMAKSSMGNGAVLQIRLNDGTGEYSGTGRKNIADGRWHHVAFVLDRASKKAIGYVDGAADFEFHYGGGAIADKSIALMAGNANPYQSEWYIGHISGIKTHDIALTPEEVKGAYEGSLDKFQVSQ